MTRWGFLLFALSASCFAATPSLKQRQDPFYIGPSVDLDFTGTMGSSITQFNGTLTGEYGWDTGIAAELSVPALLSKSPDDSSADFTPRIGGGLDSRIEASGLYRAWGDPTDYLGFAVGIGLPFQTTQAQQNGINSGWQLSLGILGRIDWDWIALVGSFYDNATYMHSVQRGNNTFFYDESNLVNLSFAAFTYPYPWLSPYLGVSETFPSTIDVAIDSGGGFFSDDVVQTSRTTEVFAGAQWAPPHVPVLLGATFNLIPNTPLASGTAYSAQGTFRWLF